MLPRLIFKVGGVFSKKLELIEKVEVELYAVISANLLGRTVILALVPGPVPLELKTKLN